MFFFSQPNHWINSFIFSWIFSTFDVANFNFAVIWGFPSMGVPLIIIHFNWIFPYEPSSYWSTGTPIYGNPHLFPWFLPISTRNIVSKWKINGIRSMVMHWTSEKYHVPRSWLRRVKYMYIIIYISIYIYIYLYIYDQLEGCSSRQLIGSLGRKSPAGLRFWPCHKQLFAGGVV